MELQHILRGEADDAPVFAADAVHTREPKDQIFAGGQHSAG
jgi:hypothetical protein